MRDVIERVATGTTTVQDAYELERVFGGIDMRDVIERVATGTTTVQDVYELERSMRDLGMFYECS